MFKMEGKSWEEEWGSGGAGLIFGGRTTALGPHMWRTEAVLSRWRQQPIVWQPKLFKASVRMERKCFFVVVCWGRGNIYRVAVGVEKNVNNIIILGRIIIDCSAKPPFAEIASELRWLLHPNLDTSPTFFYVGLNKTSESSQIKSCQVYFKRKIITVISFFCVLKDTAAFTTSFQHFTTLFLFSPRVNSF